MYVEGEGGQPSANAGKRGGGGVDVLQEVVGGGYVLMVLMRQGKK